MKELSKNVKWHIFITVCTVIAFWIIHFTNSDNNIVEYIGYILGTASVLLPISLFASLYTQSKIASCSINLNCKEDNPEKEFNFEREYLEYNGAERFWRKGILDNNHKAWIEEKKNYFTKVENIEEFKLFLEAIRGFLRHGITIIKIIIFPLVLTLFTSTYQSIKSLKDDVAELTLKAVENLRDGDLNIEIPNDFYINLFTGKGHDGLFWFLLFLILFVSISIYLIMCYLFLAKREEFVDKTFEVLAETNSDKSNIDSKKKDYVNHNRPIYSEEKRENKDKKDKKKPANK